MKNDWVEHFDCIYTMTKNKQMAYHRTRKISEKHLKHLRAFYKALDRVRSNIPPPDEGIHAKGREQL